MSSKDNFYDFDNRSNNTIEPRYNREDLFDEESNPVLCDICNDGIRLMPYLQDSLICPRCMHISNPRFEPAIKHDVIETTIEELQDSHSGTMSYVEDTEHTPTKTRIRRKISDEEMPDYVRQEIERIQWQAGYKTVPLDKKLSSSTTK